MNSKIAGFRHIFANFGPFLGHKIKSFMATKPIRPLVAIVGTTGVGKSQLAVELARSVSELGLGWQSGSVINADAMQVYDGLDVITNKITEEEKCGVPHHLIGFKKPGDTYVIYEWLRDAEKLVRMGKRMRRPTRDNECR